MHKAVPKKSPLQPDALEIRATRCFFVHELLVPIHEAGHAVAGIMLGRQVLRVRVNDSDGLTTLQFNRHSHRHLDEIGLLRNELTIQVAGHEAERIYKSFHYQRMQPLSSMIRPYRLRKTAKAPNSDLEHCVASARILAAVQLERLEELGLSSLLGAKGDARYTLALEEVRKAEHAATQLLLASWINVERISVSLAFNKQLANDDIALLVA